MREAICSHYFSLSVAVVRRSATLWGTLEAVYVSGLVRVPRKGDLIPACVTGLVVCFSFGWLLSLSSLISRCAAFHLWMFQMNLFTCPFCSLVDAKNWAHVWDNPCVTRQPPGLPVADKLVGRRQMKWTETHKALISFGFGSEEYLLCVLNSFCAFGSWDAAHHISFLPLSPHLFAHPEEQTWAREAENHVNRMESAPRTC